MLKLKKLQIQGFKSFCERAEVQFPGVGIVGIVGPNGCGKSNLADAISWVLGEQSAKSLRGGRMEDVIFAGTREKAATGMAEVSITLVDPDEYARGVAEAGAEEPEPELLTPGWSGEEENLEAADAAALVEAEEGTGAVGSPVPNPADAGAGGEAGGPRSGIVLTIRKRRKFHARNRRGEILVTRRLYRDGQSEYLMNGRPCRLRDIQELFLGTGLGPESYAIIEQGRIGQILSSKPYDRRAIIEEAAGVSKYKAKRRLAEARLEAARQNLARINDIYEEVTRQVASLKRQSAKAERYRQYKQDYDAQQRQWLRLRADALAAASSELAARRAALRTEVAAAQAAVDALEAERATGLERCRQLEDELRTSAEQAAQSQRAFEHTRQQAAFDGQQAEDLARRGEANAAARQQAAARRESLAGEHAAAGRDRDAATATLAAAQAAVAERRQHHGDAEAAEASARASSDAARARGLELLEAASRAAREAAQEETRLEELDRMLARLGREESTAHAELEAGGARRGQLTLEFQAQQSEAERLRAGVQTLTADCARLTAEAAAAREAEQQARMTLAAASARRHSLEEIAAGHGYSTEAVQQLFKEGFAPRGVLGEFVEAEAPYDHLLEQFLHDELNYVVVENWEQAGAGVEMLRSGQRGRATFLVHGDEPADAAGGENGSRGAATPAPVPIEAAGAVPLFDRTRALNGFRAGLASLLPRLRDAYAVQDPALARQLAVRHPAAYFLTPDGSCYHAGTLSGGAGRGAGPLSLKRELRELRRQEEETEAAIARHQQQAAILARQSEAAQAERERQVVLLHELEARRQSSAQAVRQLEEEQARAQARLAQAQLESERTRAAHAAAQERRAAARASAAALQQRQDALAAEQARAAEAAAAAGQARAAAAVALSAAQSELARVEERARAAQAAAARIEDLLRSLDDQSRQLAREGEELIARRAERLAAQAAGEQRATELEAAASAARQARTGGEASLAEARAATQAGESRLRDARAALELCRGQLNETQVAAARLDADADHLRQSCRDELGCELDTLPAVAPAADAAPDAPLPDVAVLEESVRALRQRIENLGPINMMALEEYEEARERHTFMETQRRDLLDSIADTQKAIQEMDAISRQKFQEAFERINEFFQESFRTLFGGGQGFLRLSEAEPGTEAGVDIVAQPPGKKLQNALLLSGGEKAMTAMALLLAIFRYQPSPFCLLDEVDAPLDEANVTRFADMLRRMSTSTQFILITHNKRSMETASTLYGVTMPQPGCSRLVSVMMEEQSEAAAAS